MNTDFTASMGMTDEEKARLAALMQTAGAGTASMMAPTGAAPIGQAAAAGAAPSVSQSQTPGAGMNVGATAANIAGALANTASGAMKAATDRDLQRNKVLAQAFQLGNQQQQQGNQNATGQQLNAYEAISQLFKRRM